MACFSGGLSGRCILASVGRTLKQKAARRNLSCTSVVGYIHLQQKDNSVDSRMISNERSGPLISWKFSSHSPFSVLRVSKLGRFSSRNCHNSDEDGIVNLCKARKFTGSSTLRHVHFGTDPEQEGGVSKEMREEKIFTIPNILCFGRILACPFIGYLVLSENYIAALLLFITAGFTDMLDGYIARRFPSQMSYLGSVLDPIADKLLVGVLTVTLTMVHLIPVPLAVIILGRDVGLILSSFVVRFISLPRPRTLTRFFDVQLPTVQVTPSLIGKVNTALQLILISSSLIAPIFDFTGHASLTALQYVVGLTTIISGVDYMITGRGFNILTKNKRNTQS